MTKTYNISESWKKHLPELTLKLLTLGELSRNNSTVKILNKGSRLTEFQELIQQDFGVSVSILNESIRITGRIDDTPLFKTTTHYLALAYILATLSTLEKRDILDLESLVQTILSLLPPTAQGSNKGRDGVVKDVLSFLKSKSIISIDDYENDDGEVVQQVMKTKTIELSDIPTDISSKDDVQKIISHLVRHQIMDMNDYPELWEKPDAQIEKIKDRLEKYCDDDFGYNIIIDGSIVRLINYSNQVNLQIPGKSTVHDLTFDVLDSYADSEEYLESVSTSIYRPKSRTLTNAVDQIDDMVKTYRLDELKHLTVIRPA